MNPVILQHSYEARRQRLRSKFGRKKISALLVTSLPNISYLTGFHGSAGVALVGPSETLLWVDPRYTLQATEQAAGVEVMEVKRGLLKQAASWLRRERIGPVGYDDATLTCRAFAGLQKAGGPKVRWVAAGGMKRKGADGAAFETIVASGVRSAWPHAHPSAKLLKKNDLVIVDLGAILSGYAADMTRTVYLGKPSPRAHALYNEVRKAQERATQVAVKGRLTGDVDAAARRVLKSSKLEQYFTHSTGHGVGLEIHEMPHVSRGDKSRLRKGCVITVEPGVYLEGFGGVRIEDTVLVTDGRPEILTPATKDAWFTS
jgi:Xaa-Pro aminopeptidase